MRNPFVVVVFVLVQLVVEYSAQQLLRMDRRLAQDIHNWLRSREGASDMNFLNWDRFLESAAARWAQTCRFEHQYSGQYGENLAFEASTGRLDQQRVMMNGMRNWFNEKSLYRFGRGSCGAACHYTQMVWARSDRVGCAMSQCSVIVDPQSGRTYRNAMYLVCFYSPQGNFVGQFPFRPGPPCSRCEPGKQICQDGLCQGPSLRRRFRRSATKENICSKVKHIENKHCLEPFFTTICPQTQACLQKEVTNINKIK